VSIAQPDPNEFHDVHPRRAAQPADEDRHRRTGNTLFTSGPLKETITAWCAALGIGIRKGAEYVQASVSAASLSATIGIPPAGIDYSDRQPVEEDRTVPFVDGGGAKFMRQAEQSSPGVPQYSTESGAHIVNRGAW
jgi:hypothetical protein